VPARGFADRSRAALGTRPSGTTAGPRGARCKGSGKSALCLRKRGPGAEPDLKIWRVPRWSAGRRAVPKGPHPRGCCGGNALAAKRILHLVRRSALRLPSLFAREALSFCRETKLGRKNRAARTGLLFHHPPLEGEGRARRARGGVCGTLESAARALCTYPHPLRCARDLPPPGGGEEKDRRDDAASNRTALRRGSSPRSRL
jgi:hypothetical protein